MFHHIRKVQVLQCQRRIILVGKTGNGKSSTANSLLQEEAFHHKVSANAVTESCKMECGLNRANTMQYNVVDTPGLFDSNRSLIERSLEVQRSVDICPEPHAFLIVFSAKNRMTREEQYTIDMLRIMFGERIFEHAIVVVTHGKEIMSDLAFQEFWTQNETLVKLVKLCNNRIVKIKNSNEFESQYVNKGTQSIFEMIECLSDAGNTVYSYPGLEVHRSAIKEHLTEYNGEGNIHEEVSKMVIRIGKEIDERNWKKKLYEGALIGGACGVGGYLAGTSGAGKAVNGAVATTGLSGAACKATTSSYGLVAVKNLVSEAARGWVFNRTRFR